MKNEKCRLALSNADKDGLFISRFIENDFLLDLLLKIDQSFEKSPLFFRFVINDETDR